MDLEHVIARRAAETCGDYLSGSCPGVGHPCGGGVPSVSQAVASMVPDSVSIIVISYHDKHDKTYLFVKIVVGRGDLGRRNCELFTCWPISEGKYRISVTISCILIMQFLIS
jgi:hypothetical protein